ncbi:MAG: cytidine deaminase [Candidatus Cloacimonetes bacterium]|nr:cytidine deaminase [Candidatus Cloacimonadota bacterium]MCF7814249.1 cytidine deaminase [Candidatus Cloacimonadota bacterium]MCF7868456.1 cytidine deaminase [Candidatus Cloacimonadota bacterium]MCF7883924.1 cytidine deaminase [Candidatus Cloacimonadota bacterium]
MKKELIEIAKKASEKAYAPYSKYKVGAALKTKSGKIFSGCNVENSSYGLTNCAERTAVFKAVSEGETEFDEIVIFTDSEKLPTPCGACRQVLSEFSSDLKIKMISNCEEKQATIAELLPLGFKLIDK